MKLIGHLDANKVLRYEITSHGTANLRSVNGHHAANKATRYGISCHDTAKLIGHHAANKVGDLLSRYSEANRTS